MTDKIDPYKHKERFEKWEKKKKLNGLSKANSKIVLEYLNDMKNGEFTARKKPLSAIRLNTIRQRIIWILNGIQKTYKQDDIRKITQKEATHFFNVLMRGGKIQNKWGKTYVSIDSYAATFNAFWHWYIRKEHEKGKTIKDITTYIDTTPQEENTFVYFTIDELKKVSARAKYEYRVLMNFIFDSGIRSPTELMNIRVSDLSPMKNSNNYELNIRDSISKTFGRKIKLLLCSDLLKEYIKTKELKDEDYIFSITPRIVNQYLKRLFKKVLGKYKTKGGEYIHDVNMYDFRHASACYWLPRYKSESALKYRFGWKKNSMIHHYSKLLGMRDTIEEEDLVLDSEYKTRLEKELEKERQQRNIMEERIKAMEHGQAKLRKELHKDYTEKFKKILKKLKTK